MDWRKSSYSDSVGSNCVELAPLGVFVGVRDSKDPEGSVLVVGRGVLRELSVAVRGSAGVG
ncbi:DUF397 domain-containing protein [Actinocorallia aurea]